MSFCPVASFVRLLRLANCLSIMAASSKFVTDAIKGCIHVCGDGKKHEIQSRSVAEHNATFPEHIYFFAVVLGGDVPRHNAQIFGHNVYNPIIDQP